MVERSPGAAPVASVSVCAFGVAGIYEALVDNAPLQGGVGVAEN
ncbi:hypothetical protein [Muribaculum intestinale]